MLRPVFSLISHRTLKRAGFIRWQFRACFLGRNGREKLRGYRNGGVGKTQPQSDTPRRVRESLGTREEMGKSVVGESGVRGRMELGGS